MSYQAKVYRKQGASEFVIGEGGTFTVEDGAILNLVSQNNGAPGAGISSGTGTIVKSSIVRFGSIIKTTIVIDITGLGSSTTDLDIIGKGTGAAYIGQITAAKNGTLIGGKVTCLKAPATGQADIDFYAANEGTGKFDDGIAGLTETALITSGGAWSIGGMKAMGAVPAANQYIYMTSGAGGTAATYTAGIFLIGLEGYDAS